MSDEHVKLTPPTAAARFSLAGFETTALVEKVYDGDTVTLDFPLPQFPDLSETYKWSCRIDGIDTPEIRTRDPFEKDLAYKARDLVRSMIMGKMVRVKLGEFDKYGRVLVSVTCPEGKDVAETLIEAKLAYRYDGGTKNTDWRALRPTG